MEDRLNELPRGWVWVKIGEILEVVRGASPRPKGDPRYFGGNIPWIMISDVSREKGKYISKTKDTVTEAGKTRSRYLKAGTLILSNSGTVCVPKILAVNGCIHDGFVAFPDLDENINILFCYYYFDHIRPRIIQENKQGVTQVNLNTDIVRNIDFPVPPLPEQHRIVAKVEELFTRLDAGVEALRKIKVQLRRYRQAVLKHAFEGKLTNDNIMERRFPHGWKLFPVGEVVKTIDGDRGPNYPKKHEFAERGHCLFLSTKNVRDGKFVFDENIFISKEKDEILRSGRLSVNDVVITTRGTLGNVALFDERVPFKNIRINSGMLILRVLNPMLNNYYLMKFVSSPLFIKQLKEKQSGTAQPQIPANVLREIALPIPPTIEEQENIVAEIESRLSIADNMEKVTEQSLKQSERLRQSILKRAFEGRLVPQDPTDEPAEKLLERIKEERAKLEAGGNREKTSKRKKSSRWS